MGKVRTEKVKKVARELVSQYPDKFNTEFRNNQELVKSLAIISSTRLRNKIAGYITRLLASEESGEALETEEGEDSVD
ncbi:MAG: 30S ribosomal protein S17e [Candidatus Bathyarchaeota archaeon]|nr:MAG: 30S ribosomal protein S17e [Candidatus Bathyarchaeota archaeon]